VIRLAWRAFRRTRRHSADQHPHRRRGPDFDALIANGNPSGQAVVTIAKSDSAFQSER